MICICLSPLRTIQPLRVAKESIFTGLNNLQVLSVTNVRFNEHFGFTDDEVKVMLDYYGRKDKFAAMKEWYDGYRFGDIDVYCPWDVINYCAELRSNPGALPRPFRINTSGNDIIRNFIRMVYNNEQALRSVIKLAYFSYKDHYMKFEELPSGEGYVDLVYLPKKSSPMPALVVELKWNQLAEGAIAQIREKRYPETLSGYGGEILLVGIAYNKDGGEDKRKHTCIIEKA